MIGNILNITEVLVTSFGMGTVQALLQAYILRQHNKSTCAISLKSLLVGSGIGS